MFVLLIPVVVFMSTVAAEAGDRPRPNVLLITVDTFRPDHLGSYGYERATSPALDALAADGALFRNTISSSSWTTPGLLSALTALWAPSHGVDVRGKSLRPGTATMASLLREGGYAAPDILYLSSIPNMQNLGLTPSFADRNRYLPNGDAVLFRALEAYADSTFFLYYHYRNLHLPYDPTPPYDRMFTPKGYDRSGFAQDRIATVRSNVTIPEGSVRFTEQDSAWIRGLYDGQVREMDDTFFGPLTAHLKRLRLYEKTLVIVTADHGEELLEHGFIGHPSTSFKGNVYDEAVRIPLMMVGPGIPAGRIVDAQVRNVDILPTVLDLLDLPIPGHLHGRSLVPRIAGEATRPDTAFVETTPGGYQATQEMLKTRLRAVRTQRWKLIHTSGPGDEVFELYDLEADPEERRDVWEEYPDVAASLKRALHRWVLMSTPAAIEVDAGPIVEMKGRVEVLFPGDGDTLRYADVGQSVAPRWTGPEDGSFLVKYEVGVGDYHLTGQMPVLGSSQRYGPYTEELWNMLALYNPFTFRIVAQGQPETASDRVTFIVGATSDLPPGRLALVRAATDFWWTEAVLLGAGLLAGVAHLVGLAFRLPADWIVSGLLLVAILAAFFRSTLARWGRTRLERWGSVAAYTLFIYATLPVMPVVWRWMWRATQGRIDYAGTLVVVGTGAGVAVFLLLRRRQILRVAAALALSAAYAWLLLSLGTSPAERLHLAEYGLLSLFILRALQVDVPRRRAYFLGWLLAAALGTVDEVLQWVIPSRVFEWKDIGLNVLSSGLAMLVIAVLTQQAVRPDGGEDKGPA